MTTMTANGAYDTDSNIGSAAASLPIGAGQWARVERVLNVPTAAARREVMAVLRSAGFRLDVQQLMFVSASRGSQWGGVMNPEKLPVAATVYFTADGPGSADEAGSVEAGSVEAGSVEAGSVDAGSMQASSVQASSVEAATPGRCRVWIELAERGLIGRGQIGSVAGSYRSVFERVMTLLDAALFRLDPLAASAFVPVSYSAAAPQWRPASPLARGMTSFRTRVRDSLEGSVSGPADRGWRGAGGAAIVSPEGVALLDVPAVQLMATIGTQIIENPGPVSANQVARLTELVTLLDQRLSVQGAAAAVVRVDVRSDQVRIVEFLREQARIRDMVALRTRERCLTCRYEKIVNPDTQALLKRIKTIRTLTTSFGAVIGHGTISPVVLVGRLLQLKQLDPDFVCPRCQGMHAESCIITFCPNCAAPRDETALRYCAGCHYDFRTGLPAETLWQQIDPMTLPGLATGASLGATANATMSATASLAPAAWYTDPYDASQLRWWDGSVWTEYTHPMTSADVPNSAEANQDDTSH